MRDNKDDSKFANHILNTANSFVSIEQAMEILQTAKIHDPNAISNLQITTGNIIDYLRSYAVIENAFILIALCYCILFM
jgi:hypothetical protein